jgi:hypothetical protein
MRKARNDTEDLKTQIRKNQKKERTLKIINATKK